MNPISLDTLDHSDATLLFIERARAADPAFTPDLDNADNIVKICHRLDGIPLAIELAAARVVVLSPEQIEARLKDRFRLLTGGARTAVARQRTLEAAVDWSYQLLRRVNGSYSVVCRYSHRRGRLKRLSMCAEATASVGMTCSIYPGAVNKSLLMPDGDFGGERRYRLLETIRQYASERLIQADAADRLRQKHFEFFYEEFRGATPHPQQPWSVTVSPPNSNGTGKRPLSARMGAQFPNAVEKGVELAGSLFYFWIKSGRFEEGMRWLEQSLAVAGPVRASLRARALIGLAHIHFFQGRQIAVSALAAEALSLGLEDGDAWVVTFALFMQGTSAFESGDNEQAEARSQEALVPPRPAGIPGCVPRRCSSLATSPHQKATSNALSGYMPTRSTCSGAPARHGAWVLGWQPRRAWRLLGKISPKHACRHLRHSLYVRS